MLPTRQARHLRQLDSVRQSSEDVIPNKKLLANIRDSKQTLTLYFNARKANATQKGDLKGNGTVWYNTEDIANILSLCNIWKRYTVL